MARCNPTMYPGAEGCSTLAAALFAAGIPGVPDVECLKTCAGCRRQERPAPQLRLVHSSEVVPLSAPRRQRSARR